MQFNSHHDSQDIVSLVGDMTGISTTNELKQITRACNEAVKNIWSWIFDAYGGWQYDDSNEDDLPVATADLTANQLKYKLPTEALTIKAVEYKNASDDWHKLKSLPIELINQKTSENEWQDTPSDPMYYALVGSTLKIYPASDTTRSDALRIQFNRGSTTFLSTDGVKTPGFASEFHEAVAVGASYFIASNKSLKQTQFLRERWSEFEGSIKKFYNKRWKEEFPPKFRINDMASELL